MVCLIVKTEGMAGKVVDIDLSDSEIDFEYRGAVLPDDQLNNLNVTGDIMKIDLITRKQS